MTLPSASRPCGSVETCKWRLWAAGAGFGESQAEARASRPTPAAEPHPPYLVDAARLGHPRRARAAGRVAAGALAAGQVDERELCLQSFLHIVEEPRRRPGAEAAAAAAAVAAARTVPGGAGGAGGGGLAAGGGGGGNGDSGVAAGRRARRGCRGVGRRRRRGTGGRGRRRRAEHEAPDGLADSDGEDGVAPGRVRVRVGRRGRARAQAVEEALQQLLAVGHLWAGFFAPRVCAWVRAGRAGAHGVRGAVRGPSQYCGRAHARVASPLATRMPEAQKPPKGTLSFRPFV
jgi:hypothetical protein